MIEDKQFPLPAATVKTYNEQMKVIYEAIQSLKKLQEAKIDVSDTMTTLTTTYNDYRSKYETLLNNNKLSATIDINAINAAIKALNKIFDEEGTQG